MTDLIQSAQANSTLERQNYLVAVYQQLGEYRLQLCSCGLPVVAEDQQHPCDESELEYGECWYSPDNEHRFLSVQLAILDGEEQQNADVSVCNCGATKVEVFGSA